MIFMTMINNLKEVITDVKNYIFLLHTINKNKNTSEWKNLNLSVDWIGRIYTIIYMRKEDFGDTEDVRRFKINQKLALPIYQYLEDRLNLHEILITKIKYIEDTYAYLLYFSPYFQRLTIGYLIKCTIFGYIIFLLYNFFNINYWMQEFIDFLSINNIIHK